MNKNALTIAAKKLLLFFIGVWIIQIGVAIFIQTNIGSDPFSVFTLGISNLLRITVGQANILITFIMLISILFIDRKSINIGTLLALVSVGPFIDLMLKAFEPIQFSSFNLIIKIIFLCLSCVIIAIGFSTLKATDLGVAPNDLLILIITDKTKYQYKWIRIAFDIFCVVIGFSLGAVVGLGTIICATLLGPAIQFFMPRINKIVKTFIIKEEMDEAISI